MDKKDFKKFCQTEFEKWGFKKHGKFFYLIGTDLLCGLYLQKSNYGAYYYVNYFYCLQDYQNSAVLPSNYESDIPGRILVMTKTKTIKGEHFMTPMIGYEEYTEDELRPFFDEGFESVILPPIFKGKKFILENLGKLYYLALNPEDVLRKLQS